MTSRAPGRLRTRLERQFGAVRRALIARHALRAIAASALCLALALLAGLWLPANPASASIRLVLLVLAGAAAIAFAVRGLLGDSIGFESYLERIETRFPEVRSWLRNALDLETRPIEHGSAELAGALHEETARRLEHTPIATLTPRLEARGALWRLGAALAVLIALTAFAPARTLESWQTLWNPALAAPPVTLAVEPGSVTITPGATLAVRARVGGSALAPSLKLADQAAPVATLEGEEGGTRRWRFDLAPITRESDYRVRVARVESPRYHIGLVGTPSPVSFSIELRAPAYARLPAQSGAAVRGDLAALRGSRARIEVVFDRDLTELSATAPGHPSARWSEITPRRWRGEIAIEREGEYELTAVAASGSGRFRYRVTPLPDAPPVIAVETPEGDLDLPAGQQIPFAVQVQDDLGLSELRLQFRKDPAAPWRETPLTMFAGQPREARLASRWDAAALALLPGESGAFRFIVFDNDAIGGRQSAVSGEYRVRFPSLSDLYSNIDQQQEKVQNSLEKVVEQAKEVQKTLDQVQRRQPDRASPQNSSFERSEELKRALERQKELAEKIQQASEQMKQTLDQAAERQAFREELQTKLKELSELMQQVQSPEFKEALKRMQQALENLDKREMDQALQQMRAENRDLLKNLERSIALLKQLREEERMESLAKRADELKAQQDALNQRHEQKPSGGDPKSKDAREQLAKEQKDAADRTEQLAQDAKQAGEQSESPDAKKDLEEAAKELAEEAAESQEQAAQQAEQNSGQSGKSGQKASESLQQAAAKMHQGAQSSQSQKAQVDLAAVRRAAQDLVSLERSVSQNLESSESNSARGDRQTDLSEGVARVADSLAALAKETPFISPELAEALGHAMGQLSSSGKDMSGGNPSRGMQSGRSGSQSLNTAVLELRDAEASMCNKPGSGQGGKSNAQKMGDLSEQQSQVNQKSRKLAQQLSQQMQMSMGDQEEMRRLAQEQQRIREQLEQVQKEDETKRELLGKLDQTKREMKEVEEALRGGPHGDNLEQKQTRILSRMLDAQRSLNRRDFDPEREAHRGEDVAHASPGALPADLLRENDRLRLDLLKTDADRYPAQYRQFIEAYLRSLNGAKR